MYITEGNLIYFFLLRRRKFSLPSYIVSQSE